MRRRDFLRTAGAACGVVAAARPTGAGGASTAAKKLPKGDDGLAWHDVSAWPVEGRGWADTEAPFDRLPKRARTIVRKAVWGLSRHSAGLCVRFETDATEIWARWTLRSRSLAMVHMPATGVSGLDLYARDDAGAWRWLAVGRPAAATTTAKLAGGLPPGKRAYTLYLPLYNGVLSLEIGLPPKSAAHPMPRRKRRPIVAYGTSILQGGCASRAGMVHTSILSRRLDREFINLGFSGSGTMDPEVAALMAELDAGAYVIDCLPNMTAAAVAQRTAPLVRTLRKARPKAPIVLVEDRTYANAWLLSAQRSRSASSRKALRKACDALVADGVRGLHYVPGEKLLGTDGEATVDSSHPTDLGFVRMADALEPVLRPLI